MPTSLRCRRDSWRSSAISSARTVAALAALALAALACAGSTPWGTSTSPAEREWRAAQSLAKSDPAAAEAAFASFLESWPRSARADDAAVELARLRAAHGDREGAAAVLDDTIRHQPRGDRVDAARLLLARLEREAGRPDEAYRVASAIRPSRLSAPERAEAYRLLAEIAAAREDRAGQLRWLAQLSAESKSQVERDAASHEIDDVIFGLDADRLASLSSQLGGQPPGVRVELRRAQLALERGDLEGATRALDAASRMPADAAERARLENLGEHLRARARPDFGPGLPDLADVDRRGAPSVAGAEGTIGVVLPLSGSFARFGEASLRGIALAAGIVDDNGSRVRLQVRDSRGDPATAAAAVAELADDSEVVAVVGPLTSEPSEAAAAVAEREQIPLLSLASRETIAAGRPHVFRLGTTPRSEIELVVEHATTRLGARRFAILHPRDAYGEGLKDLFWEAVEARGGEVVGVASYEPAATDFADPIRRLAGWLLLSDGERAALREREELESKAKRLLGSEAAAMVEKARAIRAPGGGPLPPIVDFDALFIADTHGKVELIAPQLAFHDVRGVQLLGASGWSHPDLVAIGGRHVEGAVFAESFFAGSRFDAVSEFCQRYRAAFGGEPDAPAAQAFDATSLVLMELARGKRDREAVREALHAVRGFPGASGIITLGSDGNAAKRPFLLGVRAGEIVSLD